MDRGRPAEPSERRSQESKDRPPVAAGDDNDVEMDRGTVKDGNMDACDEPALPLEEVNLCQYSGLTRLQ